VFRGQRKPGKKWLRSDTLLASALLLYEDSLNDLGIPRDEAMDPLHDGDNPYRTGEYVVSPPVRDHAETALARARDKIAKAEMPWPEGVRMGVSLHPIEQPEPIE
jgi:hypothetical protein